MKYNLKVAFQIQMNAKTVLVFMLRAAGIFLAITTVFANLDGKELIAIRVSLHDQFNLILFPYDYDNLENLLERISLCL